MNALLDWMIRGLLYLLEIMLCMRLRVKVKFLGTVRMESQQDQAFWRGVDLSSLTEIAEAVRLKLYQPRTLLLPFQVETLDLNPSANVIGRELRPNVKRETSTSPSAPTSFPPP